MQNLLCLHETSHFDENNNHWLNEQLEGEAEMINKSITQISETLCVVFFFLNLDIGLSGIFLFVLCIFYLAYFIFSIFFHHLQN